MKFLHSSCSIIFLVLVGTGCTLFAIRPEQEMSNTAAAIRAANLAQAQNLAPEIYRQATEWHLKARQEYKFKNFKLAREYAENAKRFAEQAEFEALKASISASKIETVPEMAPVETEKTPIPTPLSQTSNGGPTGGKDKKSPPYPYPTPPAVTVEPTVNLKEESPDRSSQGSPGNQPERNQN